MRQYFNEKARVFYQLKRDPNKKLESLSNNLKLTKKL